MKQCIKCQETKPNEEFYADKSKRSIHGALRGRCKKCHYEQSRDCIKRHPEVAASRAREFYRKNKDKINLRRALRLKDPKQKSHITSLIFQRLYGITIEKRTEILVRQNGRCAICLAPESELKQPLNIDHCHASKKVRGLLCYNCNRALGLLRDSSDVCKRAALYLACGADITDTLVGQAEDAADAREDR